MKKKIKLLINLVDFDPKYAGGVNTFAHGLISEFNFQGEITILTTKQKLSKIKKIFSNKNFSYITIESKNTLTKLFRLISIIFNSNLIYLFSVNLEYSKIINLINENYNILYCPLTNLRPLNLKIKTITSIHDIQHYNLPNNFSFFEKRYRNLLHSSTIKYSTKVQVSSKFIFNNIIKFFSKKITKKLFIIPEGVSNKFINKKNIFGNFLFFPAQLWPHKNHLTVLKAIKILNEVYKKKIKIILVGKKYNKSENIINYINQNKDLNIQYLGQVTQKQLYGLYINCRIVVCPALYESSSLTLLESVKMNKPIVASNTGPNLELNKFFKINYFEKNNPQSFAKLIHKIWNNKVFLNKQKIFNKKKINLFNWNKISKKYEEKFKEILY